MDDDKIKFRYYRILVYILGSIIFFEFAMLLMAIPVKTTFIVITLAAIGLLSLYLLVLCLRLIRELQKKSKNE